MTTELQQISKGKKLPLAQHLRRAVMRVSRRLRAEATSEEVTPAQMTVLSYLARADLGIGELAELEHIQAPSMTRTVNNLESLGFVQRRPHEQDKRQVVVSITDTGKKAVRDTRARRNEWLQRRLNDLDAEERAVLRRASDVLLKLAER